MAEKKRILLVDDTPTFLIILNNILKNDYETLIATDGEDAIKTARHNPPDLILCDVLMPGMSGYDVLIALKADETTKSIPVVLVSGKDSDEHKTKGYDLGAAAYIKKPFEKAVILDTVIALI